MTSRVFRQGMALMTKSFNLNPGELTLKAWAMLLEDIGDRDYIQAVVHICRNVQTLPRDVNVSAFIRNQISAQKILSGDEAWQEVLKAISRVGRYGIPEFPENRPLEEAVKSVGWLSICDCENSKMAVMRSQFLKAYEACQGRRKINDTCEITSGPIHHLLSGIGKQITGGQKR